MLPRARARGRPVLPSEAQPSRATSPCPVTTKSSFAVVAWTPSTIARPQLAGVAQVLRGEFELAGKSFELTRRSTVRLAEDARRIRLDLSAVHEAPTLTAIISVTGTAANPEIELSSRPQLPGDEILA